MREVPTVLFNSMRRLMVRHGIDTRVHLRGLSLAEVPETAFGGRVDWDELAVFLERCAEGIGDEEQERMGELYPFENRFLQFVVRGTLSPKLFHGLVWRGSRPAFPHMEIRLEELTDTHVVVRFDLPRSYRGSAFFFRGTVGECRTMTELLGLGPSEVTADVGPWHGRYFVRFPAPDAPDDLRAASRRLLGDRRWKLPALVGWLFGYEKGADVTELMRRLERVHGLERAEAVVIVRLGQGMQLREIASELGWTPRDVEALLRERHDRMSDAVRSELVQRVVPD